MTSDNIKFPIDIAKEFPQAPNPEISRDSNIEMIDRLFEDHSLLFLESPPGMGATTTAAQYCNKHPESTFALFIRPASRVAYSVDYLRLVLAEQFYFYLNKKNFPDDYVTPNDFNKYRIQIRRKATKNNPIRIVIDGLHQIPKDEKKSINEILQDLIPFGWDNFKFLIIGNQNELQEMIPNLRGKPAYVLEFTKAETSVFLNELKLDDQEIETLHKLCRGTPGRLATVRRMITGGTTLSQILDVKPEAGPEFIQFEFKPVDKLSSEKKELIALLAYSGRPLDINETQLILGISKENIQETLKNCTFLEKINENIEFVSEAHRQYAARLLEEEKRKVLEEQIKYLLKNPSSPIAINFLPTYYQQLEKTLELIKLLNEEHFTNLLDETASLGSLKARAYLGLKSAISAQEANEIFSFTLKSNLVSSIASAKGSSAEVRALVTLGEQSAALDLVDRSLIREERLAFLASYAKECKASNIAVSPDILKRIQEEAFELDFELMGDTAIIIATDLLPVDQALAMSIAQQAKKSNSISQPDTLPVAPPKENDSQKSSAIDNKTRLSDEALFFYNSALSDLVEKIPKQKVQKILEQINEYNRLEFLSIWISKNSELHDAIEISEHALDLMIELTAYTPKMGDLCDFASPLKKIDDKEKLKKIISRFDSQLALIKDTSISEKSIELQIKLAEGECLYSKNKALERIKDTYEEIQEIKDIDIKIDCLAKLIKENTQSEKLKKISETKEIEKKCIEELNKLIDIILSSTADQYLIIRNTLKLLTIFDLETAHKTARKINTQGRRDQGYGLIAIELTNSKEAEKEDKQIINNIIKTISFIENNTFKHSILEQCLKTIQTKKIELSIESIEKLRSEIEKINLPELKGLSIIWLCGIASKSNQSNIIEELLLEFETTINTTMGEAQKIFMCFQLTHLIYKSNPEKSYFYLEKANAYQNEIAVPRADHAQALAYCCGLATRAISWLSLSSNLDNEILDRFLYLTSKIASLDTQIEIISDLSCRLHLKGKGDLAKEIIANNCYPTIEAEIAKEKPRLNRIIEVSFPALYLAYNQELAINYLKYLDPDSLSESIEKTIDCILHKRVWTDPNSTEGPQRCKINYAEALSVCKLIEKLEADYDICNAINNFCKTINHKNNTNNFTFQQLTDIAEKLTSAFDKKLPDIKNIKHEGYKIICQAAILTLKPKTQINEWKKIEMEIEKIPNIADKSFVFAEVSDLIPSKFNELKKKLRDKWFELSNEIPSLIDKIGRLSSISEGKNPEDITQAKTALRSAILLTFKTNNEKIATEKRRQIINTAAKIDEKFANELADLIDEDPARENAREEINQQLNAIKTRKKLINMKNDIESIKTEEEEHITRAAWESLGSLLSNRIETKDQKTMGSIVKQAHSMNLDKSYPLLAWYIENLGVKYSLAKNGDSFIRAIVEKTLTITELAISLIQRTNSNSRTKRTPEKKPETIGINNREKALNHISNWLKSAKGDIILCDPYFSPKDIEFLALVLSNAPESDVVILTSRSKLEDLNSANDEKFLENWWAIKDQDPPATQIIAVSQADSIKTPLHDRWILCESHGVRLGTSFNSIGKGKLSEISKIDNKDFPEIKESLDKFIAQEKTIEGTRIKYLSFSL